MEKPDKLKQEIQANRQQQQQKKKLLQLPSKSQELNPGTAEKPPQEKNGVRKSLLNLCVASLGSHLHEIVDDIHLVADFLPPTVKIQLVAIARRRGLLRDELLVPLADEAWELLDLRGSDVTDAGIRQVAKVCHMLKAIDVSCCSQLSAASILEFVHHCPALQTLRCGGTHLSNTAARLALPCILPGLNLCKEVEDDWEDLDVQSVATGAQSLRWIVWPSIDEKSRETVSVQCPKLIINPKPAKSFISQTLPREALAETVLDDILIEEISPTTWQLRSAAAACSKSMSTGDLSLAERFRLAFVARDERLAPKRAKNSRRNQRRDEKRWLSSNVEARALQLATEVDLGWRF